MKEENKKSKKKILLTYLILAACLLVIAAVTVTVVLTVTHKSPGNIIDNSQPNGDDGDDGNNKDNEGNEGDNTGDEDNKGNEGDNTGDDEKPTGSTTTLALPLATANVTVRYDFAYDVTLDRYCVHQGMDFDGAAGTNVCAVLDGTITEMVTDHILGENYITVTHTNGMTSTYKYVDAKSGLKKGDTVKRGDVIGTIAQATGMEMKQGDHLHFELSVNGKNADPDLYLDLIEK